MRKTFAFFVWILVFCVSAWPTPSRAGIAIAEDESSAVILAYHRIGEDEYPESNLRLDQFLSHVEEIEHGIYNVMPLPDLIRALKNREKLPENTIAITFEGAYKSALTLAIPILLKKSIPFTIFFASDHADSEAKQHLSWDDLRELKQNRLVTLGIFPASYIRLSGQSRENILNKINKARLRYKEELGEEASIFSYPFGEYSLAYKKIIEEQKFEAALALHSGSISASSDFFALPRFTMTEIYGDRERFKLVAHALPLPVYDIEPSDPYLKEGSPTIGFSIAKELSPYTKGLSCFISGQDKPGIEILGERRVELRLAEPLSEERTRVNCTMPGPDSGNNTPNWRWYGLLLVRKNEEDYLNPQPGVLP